MPDIPYQGKDIVSKTLTNLYKDKSFEVYGLTLPPIKAYLPTDLPSVEASDRISDHLFFLYPFTLLISGLNIKLGVNGHIRQITFGRQLR